MKKRKSNECLKYIFYSVIGAVIFISVFTIWANPSVIKFAYEKSKNLIGFNVNETSKEELKIENPEPFAFDRFNNINYLGYEYQEDETSDFIVVKFKDSSGYLNQKCFRLIVRSSKEDITLCEGCSNKTEGDIYCSIYNYLHNPQEGILLANLYAEGGGISKGIYNFELKKEKLMQLILENAEIKCKEGIQGYCDMLDK